MKVLDIDMDYFLEDVPYSIPQECTSRVSEDYKPWNKEKIIDFIENNLGLSTNSKIKGKIVQNHHEALYYWNDLVSIEALRAPFEVIHVDSHADLGLGFASQFFIFENLLGLDVDKRVNIPNYENLFEEYSLPGIGDYLLFAIAFRWISKLTYVANPNGFGDDYPIFIMKNFQDSSGIIQLPYNNKYKLTKLLELFGDNRTSMEKKYLNNSILEPEVPFEIKKNIDDVKYNGDFDFITFCISPNYTPKSADFIIDIFKEYIEID